MRPTYKKIFEDTFGEIYDEISTNGYTPFYQSYSIGDMAGRLSDFGARVIAGELAPATAAENLRNFYASSGVIKG